MSIEKYKQNIILDLNCNQAYSVVNAKQWDQNTRQLNISFTEDGVPRTFSDNTYLQFRLRKPDGTSVILDSRNSEDEPYIAKSSDNKVANVILTSQCLAAAGRGYADLLEYNVINGEQNEVISAASFIINIMSAPNVITDLKSESQYSSLFDAVDAAIDGAERAAASAAIAEQAIIDIPAYVSQAEGYVALASDYTIIANNAKDVAVSSKNSAEVSATIASASAAYIDDFYEEFSSEVLASFIRKSIGPADFLSIEDGADNIPVKSFTVDFTYTQEGEGDPSPINVRLLTGKDEVSYFYSPIFIIAQPEDFEGDIGDVATFEVAALGDDLKYQWQYKSSGGSWGNATAWDKNNTEAASAEITQTRLSYQYRCVITDANGNQAITQPVRLVQTGTMPGPIEPDYTPTVPTEVPASLGETRYAGTFDFASGMLTITRNLVTVSELTWTAQGDDVYRASFNSNVTYDTTEEPGVLCSAFRPVRRYNFLNYEPNNAFCVYKPGSTNYLYVRASGCDNNANTFKTTYGSVQFLSELATPTTAQLEKTDVRTNLGRWYFMSGDGALNIDYRLDINRVFNGTDGKLDATYDADLKWADVFGDDTHSYGWETGYYNDEGKTGSSDWLMRTENKHYFVARTGDEKITFIVPEDKHAAICEYDGDGSNGRRYGNPRKGANVVEINITPGKIYKFCIGLWTYDPEDPEHTAATDINDEFLSGVHAIIKRSFYEWQVEQEQRLDALSGSAIPDYWTKTGYLQNKIDEITEIQKTISQNSDSFLLVSDYHIRTNQGHSLALIKEVADKTGIQKLFFAGDAGGSLGTSAAARSHSLQQSVGVWSDLAKCTADYYGVLGNHEWINDNVFGYGSMLTSYLNRYANKVSEMSPRGNYYIDNVHSKIRYYFVQVSYGAAARNFDWVGKSLEAIEDGWSVAIVTHHGFIPGTATQAEYDKLIDTSGASHTYAHVLSAILAAYHHHKTEKIRIAPTDYYWDFTQTPNGVGIGVFCGHLHHGTLFTIDDPENRITLNSGRPDEEVVVGVPIFRAGTDSLQAASIFEMDEGHKVPWYWQNGIIGGTKVIRRAGTTNEQCFYAVQIDLDLGKVYITAIGGDHNWEFDFNATLSSPSQPAQDS